MSINHMDQHLHGSPEDAEHTNEVNTNPGSNMEYSPTTHGDVNASAGGLGTPAAGLTSNNANGPTHNYNDNFTTMGSDVVNGPAVLPVDTPTNGTVNAVSVPGPANQNAAANVVPVDIPTNGTANAVSVPGPANQNTAANVAPIIAPNNGTVNTVPVPGPANQNAAAGPARNFSCDVDTCDFITTTWRLKDQHFKDKHLGTICYWKADDQLFCGHTTTTHEELRVHFNWVHLGIPEKGQPNGENRITNTQSTPYQCPWPGNDRIQKRDGGYIEAEGPCQKNTYKGHHAAERDARFHQHDIWVKVEGIEFPRPT
ncbi:hypothetical protein F5B17DRAFT_414763 [Nemania serpens]|nr:hypothetical protein F5B17DRAFT_414763 [Nemania serpens]